MKPSEVNNFIGSMVIITRRELAPYSKKDPDLVLTVGRIVGASDNRQDVVVELYEEDGTPNGWDINTKMAGGAHIFTNLRPKPTCGWWVQSLFLEVIAKAETPRIKITNEWPHTCPRCGGSALILFSSITCKTNC